MSPHTKIDTLIVSDLHLGSHISRASKLHDFLTEHKFKRLILLGDLFDNADFNRLSKENWDFLSHIRALAQPNSGCEVVWIRGNHDKYVGNIATHLAGTKMYEQYVWESHGNRHMAIHGDAFDSFLNENTLTDVLSHKVFLFLQRFDREAKHIVRFIDYTNNSLRKLSQKVADRAIAYARERQITHIFCGHTHEAMQKVHGDEKDRVHYYNVGCWTRSPSTFAVIDDTGAILMEQYA